MGTTYSYWSKTEEKEHVTRRDETIAEKASRLDTTYVGIANDIYNCNDYKKFFSIRNRIVEFEKEAGENSIDVFKLKEKMRKQFNVLRDKNESERKNITVTIEKIMKEQYSEPENVLNELETKANFELSQLLLSLPRVDIPSGKDRAKQLLNTYVKNGSQVQAVAASKLYRRPEFANIFTEQTKQMIHDKMTSPEVAALTRDKQKRLEQQEQKLARVHTESVLLAQAEEKLFPQNNGYWKH